MNSSVQPQWVTKRDGRRMGFDQRKIEQAVGSAFRATDQRVPETVWSEIAGEVLLRLQPMGGETPPSVEAIQDLVEESLAVKGYYAVAKNYILYRAKRSKARDMKSRLMRIYEDITFTEASGSDMKRENANVDGDTAMGAMLKYGSEGSKHFTELFVLKDHHARAHREGDIHIHDLDFYNLTTTCTQIDLQKLFQGGFSTGHGDLRPPKDIRSYAALACIAIQSNQNDQHGGQSIPNFDSVMAEGIEKTYGDFFAKNLQKARTLLGDAPVVRQGGDAVSRFLEEAGITLENQDTRMPRLGILLEGEGTPPEQVERILGFAREEALAETERATYQAMEALIHNLNTMNSRAGAQVPFSSINYGTDTTAAGRMAMRALLLALERGLGRGETPIFPIHIFRVMEGVNYNPEDPNYDLFQLAMRVSAKRLFPNFAFQDAPFNKAALQAGRPETLISYMGCRTRVIANVADPAQAVTHGRGNLSFTSINLPRLALLAEGDRAAFFQGLTNQLELVVEQLKDRYRIQCARRVKNFPFLMGQGVWLGSDALGPEDSLEEVLRHGTLSVGFIGLAECLTALLGAHHGTSEEAQTLGLEIVGTMRRYLDGVSRREGLNYTLIASPAEGLAGRFVALDCQRFGVVPGVTDRAYYTNSFHVPVHASLSAYRKILLEAPYHALTNAGHITYVELDGDAVRNLDVFEKLVRHMKESGIGYGSINHPVDRDPLCGYAGIIGDICPGCGRREAAVPFTRIRRITGYLVGSLERFNDAKRREVADRKTHGEGFHA